MKKAVCVLLIALTACLSDKPQRVTDPQQGYTAVFPGAPMRARHSENTPFGDVTWFSTAYTGRLSQVYMVEVGTLPPGQAGGETQGEILQTLKNWISTRYPGQISDLEADLGPGIRYHTDNENIHAMGMVVFRRGRLHHASASYRGSDDFRAKNFLGSFSVDP